MKRKVQMAIIAAAMVFTVAGSLYAGGLWLEFGHPKASHEANAKDAVLIVRPTGCHQPEKAKVEGTAEGLVNGKRQSLPLTLVPLSQPGMYAVKFERPKEGAWVLSLAASEEGWITGGIAPLGPQGFERKSAQFFPHKPGDAEVQAALLAMR